MPKKLALVDYEKCDPARCSPDGLCPAALACPHKIMLQEEPGEAPVTSYASLCVGCSKCLRACPLGAVELGR